MSFDPLDPNRYAGGAEASSVVARVQLEQADVDIATKRREYARKSLEAAELRFSEAEVAYRMCKAAREQAIEYDRQAAQQLEVSIGRLALAKAPLHPIRKAPLEVLGMIFECCIELSPLSVSGALLDKRPDVRNRQCQPFQLAAVCRRWRQACHTYAPMWRTLDLRLDDIVFDDVQLWLRYITTVITLSAAVPMHLRVFRARPFVEVVDAELVKLLLPMMHRCFHLVFCAMTVQDPADPLSLLLGCATPLLCRLYIRVDHTTQNQVHVLPDAPSLRVIDANYPFTNITTTFPGAKIVSLAASVTTTDLRRDDLACVQAACPNLDDLTLVYPTIAQAVRFTPFQLRLSILRIKYSKPAANGDLLALANQFSLPHIRSLRLFGDPEGSSARVIFLATVSAQWKTLSKLTISTISHSDIHAFCNALVDAKNLGELVLRKIHFGRSSLHRFCEALGRPTTVGGTWGCPLLKHLDLFNCSISAGCVKEDIFELVERRLRAAGRNDDKQRPARLSKLYLPQGVDDDFSARISQLFS